MRLADAHIHLFTTSGADSHVARYERLRAEHDIDLALAVGYEGRPEFTGNNASLARLAQTHDWLLPVAYLPTWPPPSEQHIDALAEQGFVGVSLYLLSPLDATAVASWPSELVERVGRNFTVVSLNARAEVTTRIGGLVRLLAPATVLFSHLGIPGRYYDAPNPDRVEQVLAPILSLAAMRHVGVKLSSLYALCIPYTSRPQRQVIPFVKTLVDWFGTDRLFWGSDYPPAQQWVSMHEAIDIYLPRALKDSDRELIFGGNLRRLLTQAEASS